MVCQLVNRPSLTTSVLIYQLRLFSDKPVSSYVQAFMSRKWGGVVLSNPTVGECHDDKPVHTPVVRVVMGTFLSQLRKLLGITNTVSFLKFSCII